MQIIIIKKYIRPIYNDKRSIRSLLLKDIHIENQMQSASDYIKKQLFTALYFVGRTAGTNFGWIHS